jgi:hypothetical protein
MSIHKLTAGLWYDYLARHVVALDATEKGHVGLAPTAPNTERLREHGSARARPASTASAPVMQSPQSRSGHLWPRHAPQPPRGWNSLGPRT